MADLTKITGKDGRDHYISVEDIRAIHDEGEYQTRIALSGGYCFLLDLSLDELMEMLTYE